MTVYLLHISPKYKHAGHYIGWTSDDDPSRRVGEHKKGLYRATPLVKAALEAGCVIKLAKVWIGADRTFERKLKNRKKSSRICPCCYGKNAVNIEYRKEEGNVKTDSEIESPFAVREGEILSGMQFVACDMRNNKKEDAG